MGGNELRLVTGVDGFVLKVEWASRKVFVDALDRTDADVETPSRERTEDLSRVSMLGMREYKKSPTARSPGCSRASRSRVEEEALPEAAFSFSLLR